MRKATVLGIEIDAVSLSGAVESALALMREKRGAYAVMPNTEMILKARENGALLDALGAASLSLPDSVGVLIASRIVGEPIDERVPGIDFASALLARMAERGMSVFLLGAREGVARRAAEALHKAYPALALVGTANGYSDLQREKALVARINALAPDLLIVCLGTPQQELWMRRCSLCLRVGLMAGLGGTLDVLSGDIARAPELWRRIGLEWLYRLLRQPKRLGRAIALPRIVFLALRERIGGKTEKWLTEN